MFSRPITERSAAKPKQSLITFANQLKIALSVLKLTQNLPGGLPWKNDGGARRTF